MSKAPTFIGAGLALALVASDAMGLGFGATSVATALGQSLDFSVPMRFEADEFVAAECVHVDVFVGDDRLPASQVHVAVDPAREGGPPMLRVTSSALVQEPVVTINVAVGCPVRLTRKFVALIDPPVVNLAQADAVPAAIAAAPVAVAAPEAQPAPPPASTLGDTGATAPVEPKPGRRLQASAPPTGDRPVRRRKPMAVVAAPSASAVAARRRDDPVRATGVITATGARLKLDPAEALARTPASATLPAVADLPSSAVAGPVASSPVLQVTTVAEAAASATTGAASAVAVEAPNATDLARMHALEDRLQALKAESEGTRNSLAALQSRLRDAEDRRFSNPLVYALAAVIALLLLALAAAVWLLRQRQRSRSEWWAMTGQAPVTRSRAAALDSRSGRSLAPESGDEMPSLPAQPVVAQFAPDTAPPAGPVTWKPTVEIPELDPKDAARRAVSADELIDLEQQAEFFITLGQDDAAIELLRSHIDSAAGASALPYLKLLDVHRRRADRFAYDTVSQQYQQRFQTPAPTWEQSRTPRLLVEHAELVAQLQAAWPAPARAMGLLESLLSQGVDKHAALDLAAYREVLFLYEVARDLASREVAGDDLTMGDVDLLLPLDASETTSPSLYTTQVFAPTTPAHEVDLDLSLDDSVAPR